MANDVDKDYPYLFFLPLKFDRPAHILAFSKTFAAYSQYTVILISNLLTAPVK